MRKRGVDDVSAVENEQIQQALSDLVNGEWESSLATLKWLYLYMGLYPEIQASLSIS